MSSRTGIFDSLLPLGAIALVGIFIWRISKLEAAKAIIKKFEGESLRPYLDTAGKWTIGIGHLITSDEEHLKSKVITPAESSALFSKDFQVAATAVKKYVKVPLTANQLSALTSLTFNIGINAFAGSTLLKKLNAGDYSGAADQFSVWRMANGKIDSGLVARRSQERALFLS